jgi:SulP family sulfate permease
MKKNIFKNYFSSFIPQSVLLLKGYNGNIFLKDLLAGLIVGIIALPLSIALAIASGAAPEIGLITAAVAGFTAALFAGSRYQITGPTGAFVIIVLGIIRDYTYEGMLVATFMAGVFLLLMGLLKIGKVVNYIAKPIIVGFTAGIAVTIFTTQVPDFLSLRLVSNASEFIEKWIIYFKSMNTINFASLFVGLGSLILMLVWNKLKIKIPGALIAVLLSSFVVILFKLNVPTIGTKFGDIKMTIKFNLPFGDVNVLDVLKPAITIALLASIESLLSAMAADSMSKTKSNSNAELLSQGLANIASACFGGLPATGAIARTSANIKNGGVTPISAIIHAIFILIVGLVLMPLVKYIPLTALAAVLFMVCKNMIEVEAIKKVFKSTIIDMILFLTTFLLTIIFDLVVAIIAGVVISFVLFFIRMFVLKIDFKSNKLTMVIEDNKIKFIGMLNFINDNYLVERICKIENYSSLSDKATIVLDTSGLHTFDMSGSESLHTLVHHFEALKKEVFIIYKQKTDKDNIKTDINKELQEKQQIA